MLTYAYADAGKYFAKMAEDSIQVYSTEDFKLLDKKSIKLPGNSLRPHTHR
jgi:hypothetical protein